MLFKQIFLQSSAVSCVSRQFNLQPSQDIFWARLLWRDKKLVIKEFYTMLVWMFLAIRKPQMILLTDKILLKGNSTFKWILTSVIEFLYIQRLIKAVFDMGIPILGTLIWMCLNLMLNYIKTTSKCNSSFLAILIR